MGILLQDNLLFHQHIVTITAKGHRLAGWALRTFRSRNKELMLTLLKPLIVHQLEYACVNWSSFDANHVKLLEGVQRRFTSRFECFPALWRCAENAILCNTPYHKRLRQRKIYSLERRRERYLIIYTYKIVIGLVPNPGLQIEYDPRGHLSSSKIST